jgi:Tfp pilus assembly protein PilP
MTMRLRYIMLAMAGIVMVLTQSLTAQMMPAKPNAVRSQLTQAKSQATQASAAKPAPAAAPAAKVTPVSAVQSAPKTSAAPTSGGGPKRDPFNPLLSNPAGGNGAAIPERLPPGKAGLMIGTLRIDGLVRGNGGMIAVVSNPQQRVYFLREGDRIFDGHVTRITMEAVSFQQTGRDAFGNSLEHEVTRRLYPNPGEQR